MKPQLIDCGSKCKSCDGYGVMTLYAGPDNTLTAPCLVCSPTKTLSECEFSRDKALRALEKVEVLKAIDEHNKRVRESAEATP